jgi:aryl-alcohol dehydrogenase-like predicted oxidoreductase
MAEMRYKLLGRSGLRVAELCLGTMTFGGGIGSAGNGKGGADAETARAIFDVYAEAGGNFVDSAPGYCDGRSEELLGDFIAADRDHFVVGTKYSNNMHGGLARSGNSRKSLTLSVEQSLRRLKTDYIDLLWVHAWDFTTPIDEVMRALDDLVRAGKILYAGASDVPAWQISRGNMLADLTAMTPFVALQILYNAAERSAENEFLPMAATLDLGITAWSPLAAGLLSGKVREVGSANSRGRPLTGAELRVVQALEGLARAAGCDVAQVAVAWLRHRREWGEIIPILGATRPEQLRSTIAALDVVFPTDAFEDFTRATAPELIFPHPMLAKPVVRALLTGGMAERLDTPRRR